MCKGWFACSHVETRLDPRCHLVGQGYTELQPTLRETREEAPGKATTISRPYTTADLARWKPIMIDPLTGKPNRVSMRHERERLTRSLAHLGCEAQTGY